MLIVVVIVVIITIIMISINRKIRIAATLGHSKVVVTEKEIVGLEIDTGDFRGETLVVEIGEGGESGEVSLERIIDGFAQRGEERVPLGDDVFGNLQQIRILD